MAQRKGPRLRVEVAEVEGLQLSDRPPVNRLHDAIRLSDFRNLVDDELPKLRELTLLAASDLLLVPNIAEMIRHATTRGVQVTLESNGLLLYRDRAEELVEVGLHRLRVITDGRAHQDDEERVDFGPVLENLAGLMAARRPANSGPITEVVYVATAENVMQLPDVVALLGGIWVDEMRLRFSPEVDRSDDLVAKVLDEAERTAETYCLPLQLATADDRDTAPLLTFEALCQRSWSA